MTLARIVRELGGDLYAGGRRANVPAPGHSPADRSVSLLLDGDRVVAHGFGGADWRAVMDDLRGRGLVDDAGRLVGGSGASGRSPLVRSGAARRAAAAALWAQAGPIDGTLAGRHARRRGIGRALSPDLRNHSAVPAAVYDDRGPYRPALLAAVRDVAGDVCAVEITYLAAGGDRARLGLARKTVGVLPAGSAVRLDAPAATLLVAEGVFSALSASERFGLPAWALLSTSNLRRWLAPPQVRRVLIAADRGPDGERSARRLAQRLAAVGLQVAVRWPPAPFGDWNEAAQARPEAGGRAGWGEPGGREVRTDGSEPRS
ncbi:MAG: DUF7146 domain-containing protein [Phenylobacterium sp.]